MDRASISSRKANKEVKTAGIDSGRALPLDAAGRLSPRAAARAMRLVSELRKVFHEDEWWPGPADKLWNVEARVQIPGDRHCERVYRYCALAGDEAAAIALVKPDLEGKAGVVSLVASRRADSAFMVSVFTEPKKKAPAENAPTPPPYPQRDTSRPSRLI